MILSGLSIFYISRTDFNVCPVALAVSLHAPNDALRNVLVPVNQKYPLRELMAACQRYLEKAPRDFVTFEYVMLAGINDSVQQARELIALVRDVPCKFNLIPFNPFPQAPYQRSDMQTVMRFRDVLMQADIVTTIRKVRGDDIAAACGTVGHISVLRRLRVGPFLESGAIMLDKLQPGEDMQPASPDFLLPVVTALADIPALALTQAEVFALSNGQAISLVDLMGRIPPAANPDGGLARAMAGSRVIGLCRLEDGLLKPERLL